MTATHNTQGWTHNWGDTSWPRRWAASESSEKVHAVTFDCGDVIDFPEPAPSIGSACYCRWHGQVRVVVVSDGLCGVTTTGTGRPCTNVTVPGTDRCWLHPR